MVFQLVDGLCDGWLADVQLSGRFCHVHRFADCQKNFEVSKGHGAGSLLP